MTKSEQVTKWAEEYRAAQNRMRAWMFAQKGVALAKVAREQQERDEKEAERD